MNRLKTSLLLLFLVAVVSNTFARPQSIAFKASVTASSASSSAFDAANINDGVAAIHGMGSWRAEHADAWIELAWDDKQYINKVVIYNSTDDKSRVVKGNLLFSDGSKLEVKLPLDGSAHAVEFDEKCSSYVKFQATQCVGDYAELSEIEVFPSPAQYSRATEWVDPYIETNRGRFFLFITGQRPYGVIGAAPMTVNGNNGGGGYAHFSDEVLGFPQIHAWTISGLNVMPTLGSVDPTEGESAWKSKFKHDDEIVQPGYHRVYLPDSKVWVEQTATERVSFYRFKWSEETDAQLLLSLNGLVGNSRMTNAVVKRCGTREYEGSVSSVDRAYGVGPHDVKIFFVVQVDKDYGSLDGWDADQRFSDITKLSGDTTGVSMAYRVKAGDEVQMKIAVSYTSIENARNNLLSECTSWDFDQVKSETLDIWDEWLEKIVVEGGSEAQRIKFYTDLWHVLLGRHRMNDVNGDYPDRTVGTKTDVWNWNGMVYNPIFKIKNSGLDADGKPLYNMYNSDAFWLTQWNLNVLWGLAWPEILDDMAASLVAYGNNGGLIPRGPSGGGYSFIMTGCPGTNLLVSAYMKDLFTKADAENAYGLIKKNHMPGGMMGSPKEVEHYLNKGWFNTNAGITIEASFQDWGAAQMAKKLGKMDDYNYFIKRSESWKNCFHPELKLLLPKNTDGTFTHEDPLLVTGYIEANAWQATWGISHDIPGLYKMIGSDEKMCEMVNHAFEMSRESDFVRSYGKGYVSYANQPGCSNAHVFSYANQPWMTQYWVRRVNEQAYGGTTPDLGWGGHDEDQGQMGGVSALMSIGLFNIVGSESITPYYEITAPVFDKVTIKLDNKYYQGKEFVIKTYKNSEKNCYIQKAKLNGRELNNFWFTHEEYTRGGVLELWLGDKPNKKWGLESYPPVN